ncbi:MAG: M20/M25/M40 family metallo-hydrolase [Oscillospiraceae bacterium]|jgi:tripeptide aminopeptidase|nr:M20/M25/M40 family metallo-hydrolase [Oscillospiraceae bacterium]
MKERIWDTFSALVAIDSPSFAERAFCDALRRRLEALGAQCYEDRAGAAIGGDCGNLYATLPGTLPLPPLLFSAHMDTVEPGRGKRACLGANGRITPAGETILGADDAAGITVLLEALRHLREQKRPHRPLELLFPVAEERYGAGSAVAEYDRLRAKQAYVLDLCGAIGTAANAAPTILSFTVTLHGKAAHAGFAPREGIHAIAAAAKAIARLPLGEPLPGVTCNIGLISGGAAGNIVPERCEVRGEIRSLTHAAVLAQWADVQRTFAEEAAALGATITAQSRCEITAYETPPDGSAVQRFRSACHATGIAPQIAPTLGGSDNNNFAQHGIEGLVIACSMHEVHSTREFCQLEELEQCVQLVTELMAGEA